MENSDKQRHQDWHVVCHYFLGLISSFTKRPGVFASTEEFQRIITAYNQPDRVYTVHHLADTLCFAGHMGIRNAVTATRDGLSRIVATAIYSGISDTPGVCVQNASRFLSSLGAGDHFLKAIEAAITAVKVQRASEFKAIDESDRANSQLGFWGEFTLDLDRLVFSTAPRKYHERMADLREQTLEADKTSDSKATLVQFDKARLRNIAALEDGRLFFTDTVERYYATQGHTNMRREKMNIIYRRPDILSAI